MKNTNLCLVLSKHEELVTSQAQFDSHNIQLTTSDARLTTHDSRLTTYDSRLTTQYG
jgi:hypothetical protein